MRVLVFLDTPRQRSYVASVESAVSPIDGTRVIAGGPGVADSYFGLANDAGVTGGDSTAVGLATRFCLTLRQWRDYRRASYHRLLEATQPTRRGTTAGVKAARSRLKDMALAGARAIRYGACAVRRAIPVLQGAAQALDILSKRWILRARSLRDRTRFILRSIRPIRLVQRQHHERIRTLPPLLRRPVIFWSRVTLGIAAIVTLTANAAGILRKMVQRQVHIREATRMIQRAQPDVVVVMEDNVEGLTGLATFAARRAGIPFVVLPDYIPNPIEPATYYWESKSHQVRTLLDWLVSTAYPKWVYHHNGRRLIRLPSNIILAHHLLRCDPPAPWILNSGYANAIALDSTAMEAHYRSLGFRPERLRVIGTAQDDKLFERYTQRSALRSALMNELGLPSDRPIVLCAFPPDQYTASETSGFEHGTYADLVSAWFADLSAISSQANVIVRPHPRTRPGDLEQVCPRGVHISWIPTEDLIPICDLYVASVSTTIRWALALGLPVLNYDCYRYTYGDFTDARGVMECSDRATFAALLQDLASDASALAAKSHADREAWGKVDGGYSRRLQNLLKEVALEGPRAQPTHANPSLPGTRLISAALARLLSQH